MPNDAGLKECSISILNFELGMSLEIAIQYERWLHI